MFGKSKIFATLAFVFTLIFASNTAETHGHITNDTSQAAVVNTFNADNHEIVQLAKKRFRCKICGYTCNIGLWMAGHIKGNHGKWLVHKYYETF